MIRAAKLRTEYLDNPLGIDITRPRFFWILEGDSNNQTAYRIEVKNDRRELYWDSGKVSSADYTHIQYGGKELQSRDTLTWRVKLWDEGNIEGEWSLPAAFEMGLMKETDWSAVWITGDYEVNKKQRYPADYFQKTFMVAEKPRKARIYLTACGLYDAYLNGERIGDQQFAPGVTDYRIRLQYQTYDISEQLRVGRNELMIILGDGWYRGHVGALSFSNVFGDETKVLGQLEYITAQGALETVITDGTFDWTNKGPIRENDLKDGERVDSRLVPAFSHKAKVTAYSTPKSASNNVLIREKEVFTPKLITTPAGKTVLDFGQNIAGYISIKVRGDAGHVVTIKLGETLDSKGEFTQRNFQIEDEAHARGKKYIKQQLEFICNGQESTYKQRFAISGFRYAYAENWPGKLTENSVSAIAVYSDMEKTGWLATSDPFVNQLVSNTLWSMKGNFLDVPTDCPTRERAAWTGDAQIFFNTGSYLMNTAPFFRKWLKDLTDRQGKDGKVPNIVPTVGNEGYLKAVDGSVGWGDASIIVPYQFWKKYGDQALLEAHYPSMKAFIEFEIKRASRTFPTRLFKKNPYRKYTYDTGQHFGEWLEPEKYENFIIGMILPRPEEATAYLSYDASLMAAAAAEMNDMPAVARYKEYETGAKQAYNYLFVKEKDIPADRQAKLVRPLGLGLLEGEAYNRVMKRLVDNIRKRQHTIGTGFLSTPFVLPLLTENGYVEDAYTMLKQDKAPGWMYQIKNGATTIWETWTGLNEQGEVHASYNHYAFGCITEWLFAYAAGIQVAGPRSFAIRPFPGGGLNYLNCAYDSIYGRVSSNWRVINETCVLKVEVPKGTTAHITLPNGNKTSVGPGEHEFQWRMGD